MKSSKSQQNFISTPSNRSDYLENFEHVEEEESVVFTSGNITRGKQIYLDEDSRDLGKRRYEGMTPSRIQGVEAKNDHEEWGKFNFFREHKKRRPPEAGTPMQFQETTTTLQVEGTVHGQDYEPQARTPAELSRMSRSASGVEAAAEIGGESDLTAENQVAEESSRSSNNDGSSMFESAAESVSRGPNTESRSVSSLEVMHCFMEHRNGAGREASVVTSTAGPSQMSGFLHKTDDPQIASMNDYMNDCWEVVPKSEPAAKYQLGSGCYDAPSALLNHTVKSRLWGRSNQEWLQLGVGSSRRGTSPATSNVHSDLGLGSGENRQHSILRQGHEDRTPFKREIVGSIGFPVGDADCEANTNTLHHEHSDAAAEADVRQFRGVSNGIPSKLEVCPSDLSVYINPATFRSMPISSVMGNSATSETVVEVQKPDMCISGPKLVQRGTARQELVLAPRACSSGFKESRAASASSEQAERAVVSIDGASLDYHLRRDQEGFQCGAYSDHRDGAFGNACPRGPEIQHRAGPFSLSTSTTDIHLRAAAAAAAAGTSITDHHDTFQCPRDNLLGSLFGQAADIQNRAGPFSLSTPITDIHLRSAPAAAAGRSIIDHHDIFQCHRDDPPGSLSGLQQRRENLHPGQVGLSWPPPSAADSAPKLIPLANNFQEWGSSASASTTTLTALGPGNNYARMDSQANQHLRGLDEWGNMFMKLGPKIVFPSQQCHLPERSPVRSVQLSAGHETNVGAQENLVALKRAIENIQKRPQCPIPPEAMNLSIASWCFDGNLQGDSKLECFSGGERMSSILSESAGIRSRSGGDHKNPIEKLSQRQSWQPAERGQQMKVHHGNVKSHYKPVPDSIAGKSTFQVFPPAATRRTNHAGLWFILQSAENLLRNGEGGLPQVSKAYLRVKDGKVPVSAVKKYLVRKLGLTSESEVEITCKGQPIVASLPLQHVRDVIWFSNLNASNNNTDEEQARFADEREEFTASASDHSSRLPAAPDRAGGGSSLSSKDILMVLTYHRQPPELATPHIADVATEPELSASPGHKLWRA